MNFRLWLGIGAWVLAIHSASAQPNFSAEAGESLAQVAERFAETDQHFATGSVHAVAIDRRVKLGDCASGFEYKFPFGVKTTLEVLCPDNPGGHRYVTMDLPKDLKAQLPVVSATASGDYTAPVWVASHDLAYGKVLSADDLIRANSNGQHTQGITALADLLGATLTRPISAGSVVGRADFRPTQIIKRQMPVMAYSEFSGGQVTSKMVALQAGAIGEFIELENPQSGRKRYGQIQSDGTVRLGGPEIQKNLVAGAKVGP